VNFTQALCVDNYLFGVIDIRTADSPILTIPMAIFLFAIFRKLASLATEAHNTLRLIRAPAGLTMFFTFRHSTQQQTQLLILHLDTGMEQRYSRRVLPVSKAIGERRYRFSYQDSVYLTSGVVKRFYAMEIRYRVL